MSEETLGLADNLPDPTAVGKNEFKKSKDTRVRILEAGIECLATIGYHATSTNTVAKYAGLTRAAMLYHFPNRLALIEAVVHYVTRRRVEMQEESHRTIPRDENYVANSANAQWELLKTREFQAFSELAMASRTDPELEAIFRPAMETFDRARQKIAQQLARDTEKNESGFDLRRDLMRFALEGLVQQDGITFDKERRTTELMCLLKLMFDRDASQDLVKEAQAQAAKELAARKKKR